jgi:dCTP deaminase
MLKNDRWITGQGEAMISPFTPDLVREVEIIPGLVDEAGLYTGGIRKVLSYGTGSYGYDLRLSHKDFRIFRHIPGTVINPKCFDPRNLEKADLHADEYGQFFILPGHSYGLGVAIERLNVPANITVICLGKSTYARLGIITNTTPAEAKWRGHLTLEFSNASAADCRIYVNEGICQLLFFEGEPCGVTYEDRQGKYQNQKLEVTLPRV